MEASASAINAPHPDSSPDEADLFFGGGDEPVSAQQPAAEPADKSGGWPDLTPEQQAQKAAEYRERHGEPEPQHEQTGETQPEEAPQEEEQPPVIGDQPEEPAAPEQGDEASEPQEAGSSGEAVAGSAGGEPGKKQSGPLEREYIVFHKLALTKRVLEHLLKQVEDGSEARTVFMEIHRVQTRNVNHAVGVTYRTHQQRFGTTKAQMAAVSVKSFQERTVEPRPVQVEAGLSIS